MNAVIGHNKPPHISLMDKLNKLLEGEARHWLDGVKITNQAQVDAVDRLKSEVTEIKTKALDEKEIVFRPFKDQCDEVTANYKPILDETTKIIKGLNGLTENFKIQKRRELEEQQRQANLKAEEAERKAKEAMKNADMSNLQSRQNADQINLEARQASQQAAAIKAEMPKGLRSKQVATVTDPAAFWKWLQANRPDNVQAFFQDQATKLMREKASADGVEYIKELVAV